jgi:hypothetical protein
LSAKYAAMTSQSRRVRVIKAKPQRPQRTQRRLFLCELSVLRG